LNSLLSLWQHLNILHLVLHHLKHHLLLILSIITSYLLFILLLEHIHHLCHVIHHWSCLITAWLLLLLWLLEIYLLLFLGNRFCFFTRCRNLDWVCFSGHVIFLKTIFGLWFWSWFCDNIYIILIFMLRNFRIILIRNINFLIWITLKFFISVIIFINLFIPHIIIDINHKILIQSVHRMIFTIIFLDILNSFFEFFLFFLIFFI